MIPLLLRREGRAFRAVGIRVEQRDGLVAELEAEVAFAAGAVLRQVHCELVREGEGVGAVGAEARDGLRELGLAVVC